MKRSRKRCLRSCGLRSLFALVIGTVLLAVPCVAAQAAFTATAGSGLTVSTRVLAAPNPATTPVAATCTGKGKKRQLEITVGAFTPVPGANYHSLTITDPAGNIQQSSALSPAAGGGYSNTGALAGSWTYEVRGDFLVPGSSNAWTGTPLRRAITCL